MNKHLIFYSTLMIGLLCLTYSCRNGKIEPKCKELPPPKNMEWSNGQWGYDFTVPKYSYGVASFNPEKPEEILFMRLAWASVDICIYNTITQTFFLAYSTPIGLGSGGLTWGRNHWIFFPMKDRQIWKIKSNGDSLEQITQNPSCFNPVFNTKMNTLLYSHMWNVPQYSTQFYLSTSTGTVLDSLSCISHIGIYTWQNGKNIASFVHADPNNPIGTIEIINPETKERMNVSSYNYNGNSENGMCWIDDNTLIYMLEDGVYKVDIPTRKTTQLRSTCETSNYGSPSYSLTLDKIVATKTTMKIVGDNLVEITNKLCFMDTEGKELETLEIPE